MDPLAHTLVGATLAESGLRRWTPLATATLVVGANAPDLDILASFGGRDAALYWRRGHTHGALAMLVLPIALTAAMLLWDRLVRRRRRPDAPPARAAPLFALAFVSVLTHPVLDWLNTYGVRLLMPFDGRWFYGDAVFIVDPWLWLLAATSVVLARSRGWPSGAAWLVLGSAATALVTLSGLAPTGAKVVWGAGLASIVALRLSASARAHVPRIAGLCLVSLVAYAGAMIAGSRAAEAQASAWLAEQGIAAEDIAAGPVAADPLTWDVIARADGRYHFVEMSWLGGPAFRFIHDPIPLGPRGPVVQAALDAPAVRGLRGWLRFPSVEVEPADGGYAVTIRDVRYSRTRGARLGEAVVELGPDLRPR